MTRKKLQPQVILLGIVSLLNDAASEMIYPLLPIFLTTTLGATPAIIGMIEGAADGLASILKYLAGSLSDRFGRRKPLIVSGYALAAGSRALIAIAFGWPLVLAARLIDRTGKGIRSAPRDAMIADVTEPENRGRAFGFHRALDHTGAIVGPLMAFVLLRGMATRDVFMVAVIPGAIAVVLLMFVLKDKTFTPRTGPVDGGLKPAMTPAFRRAMFAIGLFALANASDAFLLLQASAAGVSTAMLPLLWAAHHVVKSLFSTSAGALSDRIGRRGLLVAGWASYGAIYLMFPFAKSLTAFVALFILYAIPFTLSEGAERALIGDLVPAEARGRSFGIYYFTTGVGVLVGSTAFGLLFQNVSAMAAFATAAGLAFLAAMSIGTQRASGSGGLQPAVEASSAG